MHFCLNGGTFLKICNAAFVKHRFLSEPDAEFRSNRLGSIFEIVSKFSVWECSNSNPKLFAQLRKRGWKTSNLKKRMLIQFSTFWSKEKEGLKKWAPDWWDKTKHGIGLFPSNCSCNWFQHHMLALSFDVEAIRLDMVPNQKVEAKDHTRFFTQLKCHLVVMENVKI